MPDETGERRVLVAGIGNVFLGDDGFGVEVVAQLDRSSLPSGVEVADYGIRGYDLAYTLMEDYHAAILIDAVPTGSAPGTVCVIEPDFDNLEGSPEMNSHGMNPVEVLRLVKQMGGRPPRLFVVGCEPETFGDEEEGAMGLSDAVRAGVEEATGVVTRLARELLSEEVLVMEGVS